MANIVAVIPARAGSKRLPGKNHALFFGKPLIVWTIEAAQGCGSIQRIVVSTDDPVVMELGYQAGCEIHRRDPVDAGDAAEFPPLIPDIVGSGVAVLLQPTSPLRTSEDIEAGLKLYEYGRSVVSVVKLNPHTLMLNGAVYIAHVDLLREYRDFANPIYFPMPKERSIDIDTAEDWKMAEALARYNAL